MRITGSHGVVIRNSIGNQETSQFAGEIGLCFKEAGWTQVSGRLLVQERDITGIVLLTPPNNSLSADQSIVIKAFASAGITITTLEVPGMTEGAVEIYVGLQ